VIITQLYTGKSFSKEEEERHRMSVCVYTYMPTFVHKRNTQKRDAKEREKGNIDSENKNKRRK